MNIRTVTVIGANGTMGSNVAAIFASFGNAEVYMIARTKEKAEKAKRKAANSVRANSIMERIYACDYSELEESIRKSDLIFEAVAENMEIKKSIAAMVAASMKSTALSCSGTSGLSITELAEMYPMSLRKNFFGVHMFNPPYSMNLCELIATKYSDKTAYRGLAEYLEKVLRRTVVKVRDSTAFLANRIGFQFINEALQYAYVYKDSGGIDYIDAILGPFSGRSMAPLATADFVGLDIHKAIVDNLYNQTNDYAHQTFRLPDFVETLIEEGKLGQKSSGGGLYKTENFGSNITRQLVYDINMRQHRDRYKYCFPFAETMISELSIGDYGTAFSSLIKNHSMEADICLQFLLKYIVYSISVTTEIGEDVYAADHVMAAGFNWCPPLALSDALKSVTDFNSLVKARLDRKILESVDIDKILDTVVPSKYDYRPYFKSKR